MEERAKVWFFNKSFVMLVCCMEEGGENKLAQEVSSVVFELSAVWFVELNVSAF
jgi:hypothetical protein